MPREKNWTKIFNCFSDLDLIKISENPETGVGSFFSNFFEGTFEKVPFYVNGILTPKFVKIKTGKMNIF